MQIVECKTKNEIKKFKNFRKKLYENDPYYVSTAEFTLDMLLYRETAFAKNLSILPVMGVERGEVLVEALLIHNSKDTFLQISFFEAEENVGEEVGLFMEYAKNYARGLHLDKIYIGLNGHLSYGVGLSLDMTGPNTFDSTYSKPYYARYFEAYTRHDMVAFRDVPSAIIPKISHIKTNIRIRKIDFRHFEEEMERFRTICDETIGTTFLYSRTDKGHFYDLLKSMTFFLEEENILFAETESGEVVGFVFWHPDYNEILKKGKRNSLFAIAIRYLLFKKKIRRIKLNAIGVKKTYQGATTIQLLAQVGKYACKYDIVETNFVWCNNRKSMALNQALLKNIERRFAVYEVSL